MDLKENCTYVMHNFRVNKNDGQYRVCDHAYKLTFIGVTVVRQCELDGLPFKKYRFVEFCDVIVGQLQPGLLVDIIGVFNEVVFRHVSLRSKKVVFKLMELSNQLLSCTLRDDYCLQFLEYLDEHESESPIIVLLTNARIKEGQGSYPSSVSNSLKASKLAINQQVAPIQEFNQSYFAHTCSKIKVTMLGSNDPAQHASQSMSMTADHDPLIGLSLTSTKRQPSDECDDEARSSQISPAQLSSNKLGKHEQIE
eukprot:XP_006584413.2 uncharacterized protein LOC102661586 [Glycine max]